VANEDLDAAIRDLQGQRRRGRWRLYGIIAFVAIAPVVFLVAYPKYQRRQYERSLLLDGAGARELRDLLAQLTPKAAECRAVWEKRTRSEALAALNIDAEASCPVDLPTPSEKEGKDYVQFMSWTGGALWFGGWRLHLVGADGKVDGGGGCTSEGLLKSLAESVDRGNAKKTDLEDARWALKRPGGHEVVFLVTEQERGRFNVLRGKSAFDSFTPGTIRGRALVYSQADQLFVCGGEIEARNSPAIVIHSAPDLGSKLGATEEVLKRDLEVQLRRQIASGLNALAVPEKQ
jgi:hypothetical protein